MLNFKVGDRLYCYSKYNGFVEKKYYYIEYISTTSIDNVPIIHLYNDCDYICTMNSIRVQNYFYTISEIRKLKLNEIIHE